MNPIIEKLEKEAREKEARGQAVEESPAPDLPRVRMGKCAKCGRNRRVFKGGDVYWCQPCIQHEARRREKGKKQEGV